MTQLMWIALFGIVGSVGALSGAGLLLLVPRETRQSLAPLLTSYATGTLMGGALLGLLPHALEHSRPLPVMCTVLGGMVLFFVLEKVVVWRHCNDPDWEPHRIASRLILIGDAFHNFTDGIIIAAAFVTSLPLGISSSMAVIAHEVPQELGDFAILLEGGYSRGRAYLYNMTCSLSTLPGAILAYLFVSRAQAARPYLLALSAASFLYIAAADLIPCLHRESLPADSVRQVLLMLAGIGTIAMFHVT